MDHRNYLGEKNTVEFGVMPRKLTTDSSSSNDGNNNNNNNMPKPEEEIRGTKKTRRGLTSRPPNAPLGLPDGKGVYAKRYEAFQREKKNIKVTADDLEKHLHDKSRSNNCSAASAAENGVKTRASTAAESEDEIVLDEPTENVPPEKRFFDHEVYSWLESVTRTQKAVSEHKEQLEQSWSVDDLEVLECILDENEMEADAEMLAKTKMLIRVRWKTDIIRVQYCRGDTFSELISNLASASGVPLEQAVLFLDDRRVKPTDTPLSIGYSTTDTLEFGILNKEDLLSEMAPSTTQNQKKKEDDPDLLKLKLQRKGDKHKFSVAIKKSEPMSKLMKEYAEAHGLQVSKLVFRFDGDDIEPEMTPEELELEDDYCIDVIVQI